MDRDRNQRNQEIQREKESSERALLSGQRSLTEGAKRGGDKCVVTQPAQLIFSIRPNQLGYHTESPAQVSTHSTIMNQL